MAPSALALTRWRSSVLQKPVCTPSGPAGPFVRILNRMFVRPRPDLCPSPAWWLLRGDQTRSHPELGRQTPQRQWYYVSRPGRVGRRQACQGQGSERPPTGCCLNAQDLQTIPSHTTSDRAIAPLQGRLSPRRATARRVFRSPRRATARLGLPPTAAIAGIGNGAGWSSPVARQAHNLKAAGSNPAPATNLNPQNPNQPKPGQPAGPNAFTAGQGRAVHADAGPCGGVPRHPMSSSTTLVQKIAVRNPPITSVG